MIALVPLLSGRISKKDTLDSPWIKFPSILRMNMDKGDTAKYFGSKITGGIEIRKNFG